MIQQIISFVKGNHNVIPITSIVLLLFIGSCIYKHFTSPVTPPVVISIGKDVSGKELIEVKKIIPNADFAVKHISITPSIGKRVQETIVVTTDKKILTLSKQINDFGWHKNFGVFGSLGLDTGDIGLVFGGPWYWRMGTDAMVGLKKSGLGLNFQFLNNTYAGVSYNINYQSLLTSPAIYLKVEF